MTDRRRFLIALMASILLHLGIVAGPGWLPPSLDELLNPRTPARTLDAWLVKAAERPVALPRPTPKPRPNPKSVPEPDAGSPELALPPSDSAAAEQTPPAPIEREEPTNPFPDATATEQAPDVTATEQTPATPVLYSHVWIRYSVAMGEGGFVIGEAVQEFRNDGQQYFLRSETGTTGLARLFKAVRLVHTSEGDVVANSLRPRRFLIERQGEPDKRADFDWETGEVSLSESNRRFPLAVGSQDMLSMFCQLALMPIEGTSVTVPVVTSKKVEQYRFEVLGTETLSTPMGEQPALHLRTRGEGREATEVWLGLNYARLPLRIRHVDRKGELFDQIAASVEVDPDNEIPH